MTSRERFLIDQLLNRIESRMEALTKEQVNLSGQLSTEKKHRKRRRLQDRKRQIETELKIASTQEDHLNNLLWGNEFDV